MSRIIEVTLDEASGDTKTTLRQAGLKTDQYALILLDLITDISKMISQDCDAPVHMVYHTLVTMLIHAIEEAPATPERPQMLQ